MSHPNQRPRPMSDVRKQASELAKKLNWSDIVGNIDNLKVEMLWRLYAGHIFDGLNISAEQYKETKQAYYVAFAECFKVMSDIADRYDENTASDILSRLCKESNAYIDSLINRTLK